MNYTVEMSKDKKAMVVTIPLSEPKASASGKTLVVASSHGNQATPVIVAGKPVILGFNAYIKP